MRLISSLKAIQAAGLRTFYKVLISGIMALALHDLCGVSETPRFFKKLTVKNTLEIGFYDCEEFSDLLTDVNILHGKWYIIYF